MLNWSKTSCRGKCSSTMTSVRLAAGVYVVCMARAPLRSQLLPRQGASFSYAPTRIEYLARMLLASRHWRTTSPNPGHRGAK
jgi:hypothetical protein